MKAPQLELISEEDLVRSLCKDSFYFFLREFWETIIPEPPIWNWHIEYLCNEIQKVMERVFRRLPKEYDVICNVSPGSTKTTIFSVGLAPWAWTRMPECRVGCISYSQDIALDSSRLARDIIKSPKYKSLFPWVQIREDQDSKGHFINTRGGHRFAVGVGGSITGRHNHILVIDDPLNPQQSASAAELKICNDWMAETLPSRKVDRRITPELLVMQRLAENDPTGVRLENKAFPVKHFCFPAELTSDVSPREVRAYYQDGLFDPVRLPKYVLDSIRRGPNGEFVFASQYLQTPIPRGGGMFHTPKIHFGIPPQRWKKVVRFWDKAATPGGGAWTVGVKMGRSLEDQIWILDVVRGQWDSAYRESRIKTTAEWDGPEVEVGLEQEAGSGGKESAEATVRNLLGHRVTIVKVSKSDGDKIARADPLSSQVNAGNVYMVKADWNEVFLNELRHFPFSRYKDQVDASANGFNLLAKVQIICGALR